MALAPTKKHRLPTLALEVIVLIWAIISLYSVVKHQVKLPKSNLSMAERYSEQAMFWSWYAKHDVLTDLAVMLSPFTLVGKLQFSLQTKTAICLAFSLRILVIISALFRINQMDRMPHDGADLTFNAWMPALATCVQLFLGVVAACIPHLRPFRDSVHAGCLTNVEERDGVLKDDKDDYALDRLSRSNAVEYVQNSALKSRGNSPRP